MGSGAAPGTASTGTTAPGDRRVPCEGGVGPAGLAGKLRAGGSREVRAEERVPWRDRGVRSVRWGSLAPKGKKIALEGEVKVLG